MINKYMGTININCQCSVIKIGMSAIDPQWVAGQTINVHYYIRDYIIQSENFKKEKKTITTSTSVAAIITAQQQ